MRIDNAVPVKASPEEVFAVVNDVERVAGCMPGATLEGRDGDAWTGRVKVKVGPVTAAYSGTVRFLEADEDKRRLRVQARGADTHGSGDAEAEVVLEVAAAPEGAELRMTTDLVIRGKIAQFGKGAVAAVSDRILQQFAANLGSLLDQERRGTAPAPAGDGTRSDGRPALAGENGVVAAQAGGSDTELNGLAVLLGPAAAKYAPVVGAFAFGLFEGWLLSRAFGGGGSRCGAAAGRSR
ncbi:SRPBCC family protein [Streptomyces sp. WMMB 322]|uniref:SRPBCC family protein n=1 Tax=Streptomyces sp. WMMB 322 TaxID=1286821 RepID=UPI0006E329D5|nr:SRPBCC family protein [Streptomyces sp. WMMB 322]SCK48388.1 Carbon monoxide dehydrogenase subunit G [Streptomyces sp. WMMB 322]